VGAEDKPCPVRDCLEKKYQAVTVYIRKVWNRTNFSKIKVKKQLQSLYKELVF